MPTQNCKHKATYNAGAFAVATPLSKQNPIWLATQSEDDVASKHYKRSIRYYKKLYQAWPDWADETKMAAIYKECKRLRKRGLDYTVDHIVPISHPHVCGLHNEFNLQILSAIENGQKSNNQWPDMWLEQTELDLFNTIDTDNVQSEMEDLYVLKDIPKIKPKKAKVEAEPESEDLQEKLL